MRCVPARRCQAGGQSSIVPQQANAGPAPSGTAVFSRGWENVILKLIFAQNIVSFQL